MTGYCYKCKKHTTWGWVSLGIYYDQQMIRREKGYWICQKCGEVVG